MAVLTSCPQCGIELATENYDAESIGRCANCGGQFGLDARLRNLTTRNRKATLSAVLGIGSFLGLFLTGIPAVILGWLALKAIREKKTTGGRTLAITGIISGSAFSLLCGTTVVGLALLVLAVKPSEDPQAIQAAQKALGSCELPAEVEAGFTSSVFGMRTLAYQNDARTARVTMFFYPRSLAPNVGAAMSQVESTKIGMTLRKQGSFTVEGTGGSVEVTEERGTDDDGDAIRVYSGAMPHPDGWVVMLIRLDEKPADGSSPPDESEASDNDEDTTHYMSLEDVKRAFESFQPPKKP